MPADQDLYDELRRIARRHLAGERRDHTLSATDLVHEAWQRCSGASGELRASTKARIAETFRRVLIDHARARGAAKRGGRVTFENNEPNDSSNGPTFDLVEIMDLHDALQRLHALNARQSRIVELKYFGGMTNLEVASAIHASLRTVEKDWRTARAWLRAQMTSDDSNR